MKGKYDIDNKTPTRVVVGKLIQARKEDLIYIIARIIGILRGRGLIHIRLLRQERKKLIRELRQTRYGKLLPADCWLPRGYYVARLLLVIMNTMPDRSVRVTKRDVSLMRKAANSYRRSIRKGRDRQNDKRQLSSLRQTAHAIGVKL